MADGSGSPLGFLGSLIPGLGAVSSLFGLFSSANAARQAQEQQQQQLQQAQNQLNAQYENTLTNNAQNVWQATGLGGDAIQAMGRRLGDSMAHGGVYNSSATAGAMVNAQQNQQAQIAQLANQLQQEAWQQRQNGLMQLTNEGLGVAGGNLNYARQNYAGAAQGLAGYLGTLGKMYGGGGSSGASDGSGGVWVEDPTALTGANGTDANGYPVTINPDLQQPNGAMNPWASAGMSAGRAMGITSSGPSAAERNMGDFSSGGYQPSYTMPTFGTPGGHLMNALGGNVNPLWGGLSSMLGRSGAGAFNGAGGGMYGGGMYGGMRG